MARLNANTFVVGPGMTGPTFLAAGDEVPDWAVGLVGDHLVEDAPEKSADTADEKTTDADADAEQAEKPAQKTAARSRSTKS